MIDASTSFQSMFFKHEPLRTCIGCRERIAQSELVRFNLSNGKLLLVQSFESLIGRSVYICPREKCFDSAFRTCTIQFKRSKHDRIVVKLNSTERYILKNRFIALAKLKSESALGK